MHILLIHQAFVSPTEAGGTRHFEFARHAVRSGHRFTIVASDLSYLTGSKVITRKGLVTKQEIEGIHVLRAYTYPSLHRSFVWRVITFLSFMVTSIFAALQAKEVDLVMGTSPPIFQAVSSWFVAFVRRRPFLLEVRDLWPDFAIDMGVLRNSFLIRLSRLLELFLYRQATHIVVNSPAYREYLMKKGVTASKITFIPNGVDPSMFTPQSTGTSLRQQWGLDGKFIVTYAGALGMANDIPTILRAAEHLRNYNHIHFLLVGDGKERENLEALAARLGLSNVTFLGAQPKTQMPAILAASDACVATLQDIPMFRTTYPNKVFDYMAAGRPTILAIDGVIRQVIEAAGGGIFVPPGNDRALAEAVLYLANHPAEAKHMGERARDYVVQHFNRLEQAAYFIRLAETLAQQS